MIFNVLISLSVFTFVHIFLIRMKKKRDQYKVWFFSYIVGILAFFLFDNKNSAHENSIYFLFLSSCFLGIWWFYYTFPTGLSSKLLYMLKNNKTEKQIIKEYKNTLIVRRINFLKEHSFIFEKKNYLYPTLKGKMIGFCAFFAYYLLNTKSKQ